MIALVVVESGDESIAALHKLYIVRALALSLQP